MIPSPSRPSRDVLSNSVDSKINSFELQFLAKEINFALGRIGISVSKKHVIIPNSTMEGHQFDQLEMQTVTTHRQLYGPI
jgi:hypothetical protein